MGSPVLGIPSRMVIFALCGGSGGKHEASIQAYEGTQACSKAESKTKGKESIRED